MIPVRAMIPVFPRQDQTGILPYLIRPSDHDSHIRSDDLISQDIRTEDTAFNWLIAKLGTVRYRIVTHSRADIQIREQPDSTHKPINNKLE